MKLFVDAAWDSLFHYGEELCGDKVEIVRGDRYFFCVLADGLGSGVKANILSTLTSKIIATMMSEGALLEEAVETIASTLPVCSERGLAYSTFTIVKVSPAGEVYLAEFDNPLAVYFQDGVFTPIEREELLLDGKQVYISRFQAGPGDMLITFSDGVVHAGVGRLLDLGWQYENIVSYVQENMTPDTSARMIVKKLLGSVNTLYMDQPGDDSTVCALKFKPSTPCTVMVGPPMDSSRDKMVVDKLMYSPGLKVVCGGTTSQIVSRVTGKELEVRVDYENPSVPPTAHIPGIDLVTEGVLTIGKAVDYIRAFTSQQNHDDSFLLYKNDGAAQLARMVLEDSTEVRFLIGQALNPAHQNPGMPVSLGLKLNLIKDFAAELEKTGKRVTLEFF